MMLSCAGRHQKGIQKNGPEVAPRQELEEQGGSREKVSTTPAADLQSLNELGVVSFLLFANVKFG
jgi:hypothetical protein